jgi:hypothetical protein
MRQFFGKNSGKSFGSEKPPECITLYLYGSLRRAESKKRNLKSLSLIPQGKKYNGKFPSLV